MKLSAFSAAIILAFALGAVAATEANAAPISWTVDDVTGENGLGDLAVSTSGTLIEAANFGGDGVPSPTINTVTFTGIDFVAPGTSSPSNLVGLTYGNSNQGEGESGIGAIDGMFDTIAFDSGVGVQDADLTGLAVGGEYEVQFFLSHVNTADRTQTIDDGEGNSIVMKNANPSQVVTGAFTADATTQFVRFTNNDPGSQLLSGYQLRQVPVPSSLALLALSLLGLIGFTRRRR